MNLLSKQTPAPKVLVVVLGLWAGVLSGCAERSGPVAEDGLTEAKSTEAKSNEARMAEAERMFEAEDLVAAESMLVASGALEDPAPATLELMGRIRFVQFENEAAVGYYKEAVASAPRMRKAWLGLIRAYQRLGEIDAARVAAAEARQHYPGDERLLFEAGQIEMKAGQPDEAASYFEQTLAADSTFLEAYYALGLARRQLGGSQSADSLLELFELRSSASRGLELAARIAEMNPGDADAHYNLARAYERVRDDSSALNTYRQVLMLNPDFPEAQNNMGIVLLRLGATPQSVRAIQRAIDLSDKTAKYHFNLGAAYARLGFLDRAEALWLRTLELDPNYTRAKRFLDELYSARESEAR